MGEYENIKDIQSELAKAGDEETKRIKSDELYVAINKVAAHLKQRVQWPRLFHKLFQGMIITPDRKDDGHLTTQEEYRSMGNVEDLRFSAEKRTEIWNNIEVCACATQELPCTKC